MGKYSKEDCCYEEMSPMKVHEQTEVPHHNEPHCNPYELAKPESNGYNQSGMKGK